MNPMPESTPTPIITAVGTGTTWNVVGDKITCKVSGDQTQGAYAVVEEMIPPQGGPPLHLHRRMDEIFYVLEGEYQVVCGNRTFNAPQGTVFVVPKSVPHSLRNISAAPGRILVTHIPAGFENFFAEANNVTDVQKIMEIAKRHDVEFVLPHD
jgi:mannose-6-phosphate isomerase-like protein (cupin superfamily)